jgi:hypothetical protein
LRSGLGTTLAALGALLATAPVGAAAQGTVVKETQYGFSFRLPSSWKQVPLDGSDVTALLNVATHDDPSLTNALQGEVTSATTKGIKVFAVGPVTGAVAPNVNVIVTSGAGAPTGREFASAAIAEAKIGFSQIGVKHMRTSIVSDRLGHTAQITYQLTLQGVKEYGEQVYALHNSNIEIVTLTTSSAVASQSATRFVVNSWKWTR